MVTDISNNYLFSIERIFVVENTKKKENRKEENISKEEDIVSLNFKHILRNLYIEAYRLQLLYETVLK